MAFTVPSAFSATLGEMLAANDEARCCAKVERRLGVAEIGAPVPIWSGITSTANAT
jgi:hypothetical protein